MRAYLFSVVAVLFGLATTPVDVSSQTTDRTFHAGTIADADVHAGPHETIFPGLTGNQLLDSLWVHYRPDVVLSYDDARDLMFTVTDNNNHQIICIFTGDVLHVPQDADTPRETYTNPANWSTEHIWPQSKGAGTGVAQRDLHHLRSIRQNVNASRSNYPFTFLEPAQVEVWWKDDSSQTTTPDGDLGLWSKRGNQVFEVRDAEKGDVARAMFYFYTFYRNEADAIDPEYFYIQKNDLRSYHNFDLIDTVETKRNTRIETIQGNLNPFVVDTTLVRRAFFEDFDREAGWMPKGYFVDFETSSKGNYDTGDVDLNGITWRFDNARIGGDSGDMLFGSRAARLRVPAQIEMQEDKTGGLGTLSFKASRSDFSGDRNAAAPQFVVEYSTDEGGTWLQTGDTINLTGVDELTTYSFIINDTENGRVRIRTVAGTEGRRFNIDDIMLTDFVDNTFTLSQSSFSGFTYSEGEGPSASQSFTILAEELKPGTTTVSLSTSANFQISTDNEAFSGTVQLSPVGGSLPETTLYLRLRGGLPASGYNSDLLTITDGNDVQETAGLSGIVTANPSVRHIDFDNPDNWISGSGGITSYQTDHVYEEGIFSVSGGPALRETATEQGDVPRALGTYAWRLRHNVPIDWRITIATGGVGQFSVDARRWATGVHYDVAYSVDGGASWNPLFTIDDAALNNANEWKTFEGIVDNDSDNIIIRFSASGTNERLMVDNFQWSNTTSDTFSVDITGPADGDLSLGEGWRFMSTPVQNATFFDLFDGSLWLQGPGYPSNSDAPESSANLLRLSENNIYTHVPANELEEPIGAANGFAIYVFADDNYDGTPTPFPKTVSVTGFEHSGTIEVSNLNSGEGTFSLVGNPFAETIVFSGVNRTNMGEVVYVYDYAFDSDAAGFGQPDTTACFDEETGGEIDCPLGGAFRAWNGIAGSLSGGHIAPFQGFLVYHTGDGSPSLEIPESAKVSEQAIFFHEGNTGLLHLAARVNASQISDTWLSFSESGSLSQNRLDAEMIYPLDYRAFLSMYIEADGSAFDIKNLPSELAEPVHLPLHIYGWQPNGSSANPGFIPMSGSVEIIWPTFDNIPADWSITLTDNETGAVINLRDADRYEFEMDASKSDRFLEHKLAIRSPKLTDKSASRFTLTITPEQPTDIPADDQLPRAVTLKQNYPNPFNPVTQIRFELPESSDVRLDVFNIQGQRVATVVNETRSAGTHTVSFDASTLASGVYLYRLQAGSQVFTKKMTLLK